MTNKELLSRLTGIPENWLSSPRNNPNDRSFWERSEQSGMFMFYTVPTEHIKFYADDGYTSTMEMSEIHEEWLQ